MKRRLFGLALLASLLAAVALVQAGSAADRPLCLVSNERTRQESSSLQEGIDTAASGDTLVVRGRCVGASKISADLTLKGVGSNPTLDGDGVDSDRVLTIYSNVAVTNLTITGGALGGVMNFGTLALARSTVSGNTSVQGGGGIFNYGTLMLDHSAVSGNVSEYLGGGILNADTQFSAGTVMLVHSTVTGNSAAVRGGGIFKTTGAVTLIKSTVTANIPDNCSPPDSISGCIG